MSSMQSGEGDIRLRLVEADVVDCMIALPGQLFYSTQIPACLWFLARDKRSSPSPSKREGRGEVLFIDARKLGHLVDRARRELSDEDIAKIAATYHAWRGSSSLPLPAGEGRGEGEYRDIPGFCKAAKREEIKAHNYVLTPGRYVGVAETDAEDVPFAERFAGLKAKLESQFAESATLAAEIGKKLAGLL